MPRTYGRDGDTYGRHALVNPGGDNTQQDVLHIVPPAVRTAYRIHPTRYSPEYVGAHRVDVVWCYECGDPLRDNDNDNDYCLRCIHNLQGLNDD